MATEKTITEMIAQTGGISLADAEKVVSVYKKHKVYKYNPHDGAWLVHGGFYDKGVILRALAEAMQNKSGTV